MFGWFKREEVLLSSPVQGQLLDGDKPLSGITVTRELIYGKEYIDTTTTDKNGYFEFPEKNIKSNKSNNMFDNEPIQQNIFIKHNENEITLWGIYFLAFSPKDQTITRNLNNLMCNVNTTPQTHDIKVTENNDHFFSIYTICNLK